MSDLHRALLPLDEAADAVRTLERYTTPEALSAALADIADAVEQSLRRLVRTSPQLDDGLRLSALSPEHLPFSRVLSALREHDLISMELAGRIHALIAATQRAGADAARAADADLAASVVAQLRREITARAQPAAPASSVPTGPPDTTDGATDEATAAVPSARRRRWPGVLGLAVVVLAVVAVALVLLRPESDRARGIQAFGEHRLGVAQQSFERAVARDSTDVTARLYLARIARVEKDYRTAAAQLKAAAALAPSDPDVRRELGYLFYDLGRYENAAEQFQQSLKAAPGSELSWIGLIRALRAAGDARADSLLRQAPADVRARLGAGPVPDSEP